MRRLTSSDIARLAGVSRSTVSRVVNEYANVPEETRVRVMKVIKENNYYPIYSGKVLSGKKTKTLGLFWLGNDIAKDPMTSSFFLQVVDAATQFGYLVLSCVIDNLDETENIETVRKIFMEGRIDTGLFIGTSNHEPALESIAESGQIVGLFDYYHESMHTTNLLSVNFDKDVGEHAVDYHYSLGHRKIGIVDGDFRRLSCLNRHESFVRGMTKYGLPLNNKWMCHGGIVKETGYEASKRMLQETIEDLPTAIYVNNDACAFGVMQACRELDLQIPQDISIIGCDGHDYGRFAQPALTTFAFDYRKMFRSLVERLIQAVDKDEDVPRTEFIESTLVVRESCRPIT